MNILKQFTIIIGICLTGEIISAVLPFTFPGSVISMILMLGLLSFRFLKEEEIDKAGDFLLKNMAFFFIPAATAIIKEYEILKGSILSLVFVSIISTIITFFATYYTVIFVSKLTEGGKK